MTTSPPAEPEAGAARVVDWRPGRTEAIVLNLLAVPLLLIGLVLFIRLATLRAPASGSATFGVLGLLLFLLVTILLTVVLFAAHEGLHGLVMGAFGGRPRFGALMIGGILPALFTTSPGTVFTRAQYLAVGLTPAFVISLAGALACLTPVGLLLAVALAIHLSGCIGDFDAALRLAREPRGTLCEDLRDGMRFHRPPATSPALID